MRLRSCCRNREVLTAEKRIRLSKPPSTEYRWSASRSDLRKVALPRATSSYQPVSHLEFLEEIREQLPALVLNAVREDLSMALSGQQLFGVFSCRNGAKNDSYTLAIGFSDCRSIGWY